ncbi:MAG: ABC transporter permease [Firmicutes bacterium]|nr:ABC transporter permease [Bacillota bacterium]
MKKINLPLVIGSLCLIFVISMTLISVFFTPFEPTTMAIHKGFTSPSAVHLFGTDQFGRDILSRIMAGGQNSLLIAFTAVSSGMIIGSSLGATAGYMGGLLDEILMRVAEVLYSFPSFLLALLAVTIFGTGRNTVMIAIAIANIPIFMKITRNNFLSLKEMHYVEAAKAIGASDWRIMFKHILPNALPAILVQASVSFSAAILAEASLSYIGVGVKPPYPSWGRMLKEARSFAGLAPWTVIFPGIAIAITVLGSNLLTDGLRMKGSGESKWNI